MCRCPESISLTLSSTHTHSLKYYTYKGPSHYTSTRLSPMLFSWINKKLGHFTLTYKSYILLNHVSFLIISKVPCSHQVVWTYNNKRTLSFLPAQVYLTHTQVFFCRLFAQRAVVCVCIQLSHILCNAAAQQWPLAGLQEQVPRCSCCSFCGRNAKTLDDGEPKTASKQNFSLKLFDLATSCLDDFDEMNWFALATKVAVALTFLCTKSGETIF